MRTAVLPDIHGDHRILLGSALLPWADANNLSLRLKTCARVAAEANAGRCTYTAPVEPRHDPVLAMLRGLAVALPRDPLPSGQYRYQCMTGADGSPYLERWLLAERDDGGHCYLHRFVRSDEDPQLHDHPWPADALILWGSYSEERRAIGVNGGYIVERREFHAGDTNTLTPDTFHRVDLITPEVWTLFNTGPKEKSWSFWDRDTLKLTPWRDFIRAKGLVPIS